MKVVKKTGLVPVLSLQTGGIFGVPPEKARELLRAKQAELVPIPEDIETLDVPNAPAAPKQKQAAPVEHDIAIPDNWEEMHFLQQIKLAKTLRPEYAPAEGMKPLEYAQAVIREEVQRRAAAETPSE
ncbi:hypothetical protein MesoLjLc_50610 [Mesorhizobium sp. L-8-10]|uniref:hypothetical protein n=1 Tax=Mesorhizobium sp. L-8-10 TaxID=2744523 RepID=UPI001928BA48|nr:hypothetical protein [Mesorhizobium sp. L-8-10]BCH33131.1 hypothetical protein MesoLjLc_50610 [Mesorhizobium sp. L-8-10]